MLDWELFHQGGRERSVDYYFIPWHCIYLNYQTVTIQERQTFVRILCQYRIIYDVYEETANLATF